MIDSPQELEALVARARQAEAVALDTEFVWERTYYPRLGVVQLGLGRDDSHLIDAAALDLAPLGVLLADESVVKVLHDAQQDLTILRRATGASATNVFDTQRAAGFVGLSASVSLQNLIEETDGRRLPKGATRTDWLRRPLSKEQTEYALDDVRYLLDAYHDLRRRAAELGRTAWLEEEMDRYDAADLYTEDDPREQYARVKGRAKRGFGGKDYAVLRELAAWREAEARERDRPRGHVVPDEALVELAQRKPKDEAKLRQMRKLSEAARKRHADALLDAVGRGLDTPRDAWPPKPNRPPEDPTLASRLDLALAFIRGRGLREGLDPALVGPRAEVERLAVHRDPDPARHPILQGWRREFVGNDLVALFAGEAAVALDGDGTPRLVPLGAEAAA